MPLVTTSLMTLTNCDLKVYINPYKIVTIGQKNLSKQPFNARMKVPIV